MPDVVDPATRSRMMRGIKGANTKPELRVRLRMHAAGLRYRLGARDLPGRPDIVFRGLRSVVFVHGCFWHQHPGCRYAATPSTNVQFWANKFRDNLERDLRVQRELEELGWSVFVVWECAADREVDEVIAVLKIGSLPESQGRSRRDGSPPEQVAAGGESVRLPAVTLNI